MAATVLTGANQTQWIGLVGNVNNTGVMTLQLTAGDLVVAAGCRYSFNANYAFTFNATSSPGITAPTITKILNQLPGDATHVSSAVYWFKAVSTGTHVMDMATTGSATANTGSSVNVWVIQGQDPNTPVISGDTNIQTVPNTSGTAATPTFAGWTETNHGPALFLLAFGAGHLNTTPTNPITANLPSGSGWVADAAGFQNNTTGGILDNAGCGAHITVAQNGSTGTIAAATIGTAGLQSQFTYVAIRPDPAATTTYSATAQGSSVASGHATANLLLAATAVGVSAASGHAAAGLTLRVTATGSSVGSGRAAADLVHPGGSTFTASGHGASVSSGHAAAGLVISATAHAASISSGHATATPPAGTSTEFRLRQSSGGSYLRKAPSSAKLRAYVAPFTLLASASGSSVSSGHASAFFVFGVSAHGTSVASGKAAADVIRPTGSTLSAAAHGSSVSRGSAKAGIVFAATASGASSSTGTAMANIVSTSSAHGASVAGGSARATLILRATASGRSTSSGHARAQIIPPPTTLQATASGHSVSGGHARATAAVLPVQPLVWNTWIGYTKPLMDFRDDAPVPSPPNDPPEAFWDTVAPVVVVPGLGEFDAVTDVSEEEFDATAVVEPSEFDAQVLLEPPST